MLLSIGDGPIYTFNTKPIVWCTFIITTTYETTELRDHSFITYLNNK